MTDEPQNVCNSHRKVSDQIGTGIVVLMGRLTEVTFQIVDGIAIYQGDVILGPVEKIQAWTKHIRDFDVSLVEALEGDNSWKIFGGRLRTGTWPKIGMFTYELAYTVADGTPNVAEIHQAARDWQAATGVNMTYVVPEGPPIAINLVIVPEVYAVQCAPSSGCNSPIGYQGRTATIGLASGCHYGQILHEFGHSLGLFHEMSRPDRDQYVEILWDNIQDDMRFNFDIEPACVPNGPYDYDSIMHYGAYAFTKNGLPTIRPKQSGVSIGQRSHLSAGDIASVKAMYPGLNPG